MMLGPYNQLPLQPCSSGSGGIVRRAPLSGGEIHALPFDVHALVWHVNVDLFAKAGLVDAKGQPKLPTSPAELIQHAEAMKAKTGKMYFAIPSTNDPMPAWQYLTWVWQQGGNAVTAEKKAQLESKESKEALRLLTSLYAGGHASSKHDYPGAQQAFINGEAAVLVNGTWGVDTYEAQAKDPKIALKKYVVRDMPNLYGQDAVWSDSHMWVVPKQPKPDPAKQKAALAFLKFLNDHNYHELRPSAGRVTHAQGHHREPAARSRAAHPRDHARSLRAASRCEEPRGRAHCGPVADGDHQ